MHLFDEDDLEEGYLDDDLLVNEYKARRRNNQLQLFSDEEREMNEQMLSDDKSEDLDKYQSTFKVDENEEIDNQ